MCVQYGHIVDTAGKCPEFYFIFESKMAGHFQTRSDTARLKILRIGRKKWRKKKEQKEKKETTLRSLPVVTPVSISSS